MEVIKLAINLNPAKKGSRMGFMEINNPVVQLCIAGTQAEYQGRKEEAQSIYRQAWELASSDFEACIAAHYRARFQNKVEDIFYWNLEALNRAAKCDPQLVKDFYPSLFLNMGHAYELAGNLAEAQHYYQLAASLGAVHQAD